MADFVMRARVQRAFLRHRIRANRAKGIMVTRNGYISRRALDPRIPLLVELREHEYTVVTRMTGMRASSLARRCRVRVSNYASVGVCGQRARERATANIFLAGVSIYACVYVARKLWSGLAVAGARTSDP